MQLVHQTLVAHIVEDFLNVQVRQCCRYGDLLVPVNDFGNSSELMDGGPALGEPKLFLREDTTLIGEGDFGLTSQKA